MKHEQFRAFLDDVDYIRVEIPFFFLMEGDFIFYLDGQELTNNAPILKEGMYYFDLHSVKPVLNFQTQHDVVYNGLVTKLIPRGVVKTAQFAQYYTSDEQLGITFSGEDRQKAIKYSLYSPTALSISVEYYPINSKNTNLEIQDIKKDGELRSISLEYIENGVWSGYFPKFRKNEKIIHYELKLDFPGNCYKTNDPYATITDQYGNAFFSVDEIKNNQTKYENSISLSQAVIYEFSLRDATSKIKDRRGSFEDFLEDDTLINHLEKLGVTHVQILPVTDFAGAYLNQNGKHTGYNWGYNPESWFALEDTFGSYDSVGNEREQFIKVVNKLHDRGIGVILDVVFNHIWDIQTSVLARTVPYYYFRYDQDYSPTRFSGCGNDIASEMPMTRKIILDSLTYLVKTFGVDGFRFDIMGLLDLDTINYLRSQLATVKKNLFLYGEGWVYNLPLFNFKLANMKNNELMGIGHFNDFFRDQAFSYCINPSVGEFPSLRYLSNLYDDINKSINYFACHDGLTMFDKMNSFSVKESLSIARLLFGLLLFSPGVSFINGGDEFMRTKNGVDNSYRSSDLINGFDYQLVNDNKVLVNYVSSLIEIKKKYREFYTNSSVFKLDLYEDLPYYSEINRNKRLIIVFKRKNEPVKFPTEWQIVFNNGSTQLNTNKITTIGTYIFLETFGA